jgi:methionine-gamma-lyase
MKKNKPGFSTLVNHILPEIEGEHAHVAPIFQTSAFRFPDVDSAAAIFQGERPGYYYTRIDNPNHQQVVNKVAALEGYDLYDNPLNNPVGGHLFASGMAAISAAILSRVNSGDTIIAQKNVYGATTGFINHIAEKNNINVIWLPTGSAAQWKKAFHENPEACLAYAETPSNPNLGIIDLQAVSEISHQHHAWLLVDNTFASPFCQRPFSLGADVVIHSTTKYLSGHGAVIGGIVLSSHADWVNGPLNDHLKLFGATPSPFDAWLTDMGLKTFEVRMQRHCENARTIAEWLSKNSMVKQVYYPGLPDHAGFEIARRQMKAFGGMLAFELSAGYNAAVNFMNAVETFSLVPTLGNVDSLVQHPASMSHVGVPRAERLKVGITDGLIRLSVGIENIEDLLSDLEQALESTKSSI